MISQKNHKDKNNQIGLDIIAEQWVNLVLAHIQFKRSKKKYKKTDEYKI